MRSLIFRVRTALNKNCLPDNFCPYSLTDKTRGFYPFDVGSIPTGGTNEKARICAPFHLCPQRKQISLLSLGIERRNDVSLRTNEVCPAAPIMLNEVKNNFGDRQDDSLVTRDHKIVYS